MPPSINPTAIAAPTPSPTPATLSTALAEAAEESVSTRPRVRFHRTRRKFSGRASCSPSRICIFNAKMEHAQMFADYGTYLANRRRPRMRRSSQRSGLRKHARHGVSDPVSVRIIVWKGGPVAAAFQRAFDSLS